MSKQFSKRSKPPNIDVGLAFDRRPVIQIHQADDSPLEETVQLSDDELQLSSSSSSSPTSSIGPTGAENDSGDLSRDLAAWQQLRQSVKTNLRLRPIRSNNALPKVNLILDGQLVSFDPSIPSKSPSLTSSPSAQSDSQPLSSSSPTSADSNYFTPLTGRRFRTPNSADSSPTWDADVISRPIPPGILSVRLTSSTRPLLIDTRPRPLHLAFHIRYSINIAIPTLILKRSRKPNGGFQSLAALRQFITTEEGKNGWDELIHPDGPWDGDVVVYDDEMDPKDKDDIRCTAWALIPILAPLLRYGFVNYLEGGICTARHHPDLEMLITSSSDPSASDDPALPKTPSSGEFKKGLFQLDTGTALRSKPLPEIENSPASPPSASPLPPLPSIPVMPDITSSSPHRKPRSTKSSPLLPPDDIVDSSPSPPPSQLTFRKNVPPSRRPSVPNLRRLDTNGVSGLSLRNKQMRSATLAVPPTHLSLQVPTSPSHLTLVHSNYSPPGSARLTAFTSPPHSAISPTYGNPGSAATPQEMTPYYTPPHSPFTPKPPASPITPRPMLESFFPIGADESPSSSEEEFPPFTVSTILPNFLYLGPELTTTEHVVELQELGVRRILNIAAECDDDHGLRLREVFEKYVKIPMRDTVEEDNITWGVREVCNFLDDARLHSAPTYVHCKAGKSRSVTAVMAYLIHANHWTLTRAYAFVLERRKGISPNIGFVSELMTFEEQELGGKSVGVQPSASGARNAQGNNGGGEKNGGHPAQQGDAYSMAAHHQHRRAGHVRESLPPALSTAGMSDGLSGPSIGPMSAGGAVLLGDSAHEREIKDAEGRYRHARRVPVDATTLQPGRRVSKAGLESLGI